MNKPVKYTLLGLVGLVVLVVAAVAVFALTFDPNRYKSDIERLAKEQTGRTLAIKGDIKMAFWPSLGAQVAGVRFSEKGSSQDFVAFENAHASVKLMPLLHGQYIVDSIKLTGFKANIVKGKDGRFNFSDLTEGDAAKKPAPEAAKKKPEEKSSPVVFDVGSIDIERASIDYRDLQAGQEYLLEDVKLKTGRIAQNAEGKLEFATVAKRKTPPLEARLSLDGKYRLDQGKLSADVTAKLDDSTIKTKFTLSDPIEFEASIDKLNLDRYLGAPEKPAAKPAAAPQPAAKQEAAADSPVDLSALKGINAKGKLQVGALEVRGLKLNDLSAQLNAANGRVAVAPHSAKGYEGTISGEVVADANRNSITLKENLSGIAVGPILRDFAQQDRLEGKGDITLDVTTAGNTVNAMKRALGGTAKVHLKDGAIKGVNLAEIIQKARSALGSSSAAEGQSANDKSRKTDFSELGASFVIKNGVAHNEDLDAKAPLFRLGGAGDINIGASSLNYLAKASLVATAQGQGGRERDNLAGLTVPVKLSGTFDDLKYEVDYRGMAGQAAKSEIGGKIKDRLEESVGDRKDEIRDKLKGLLGR
jgi:AsmA protein